MNLNNKVLGLNFSYFSNFPIKSNFEFKANNLLTKKLTFISNDKKICKNFFLLILFLKYLNLKFFKKTKFNLKYSFFIKPNQQNIFNYLRAPYKNKLARNQLYIPRYKFSIQIFISTYVDFYFKSHTHYLLILYFLKKHLSGLSSNIFYINKINIKYKSFLKNVWNYNLIKIKYKW